MDLGLNNKIALVTGASRGLGFAIARTLAREGAKVCINARNMQNLVAAAEQIFSQTNQRVTYLAGDISQPSTAEQIISQTIEHFGSLDLLVSNAGGPQPGAFEILGDQAWQSAFELTLMNHVRLIRAALPYLKQSPSASVLTVTSYSAKQPIPNLVLSNSLRAAAIGLTKTLALELGNQSIRFNSILPAWTETERVYELMRNRAEVNQTSIEEEIRLQSQESPLGRMGTPQEFANAAVFLLSPAASYLTGVMLSVDGGMIKGTL